MERTSKPFERVEPDPDREPLRLPGRVLNELYAHALETLPEECCGLVVGRDAQRYAQVFRCRNEMTMRHRSHPEAFPRDGREAYWMSEADLQLALEHCDATGDRVTGVYHSHVGADAYLSELDQEFAAHDAFPFPDATQLVIAVWARQVARIAAFDRESRSSSFAGRVVAAEGSN